MTEEQVAGQIMTEAQMITTQKEVIGFYKRKENLEKMVSQINAAIESHTKRLDAYDAEQAELLKPKS